MKYVLTRRDVEKILSEHFAAMEGITDGHAAVKWGFVATVKSPNRDEEVTCTDVDFTFTIEMMKKPSTTELCGNQLYPKFDGPSCVKAKDHDGLHQGMYKGKSREWR